MLHASLAEMQLRLNLKKLTHVDYTVKTKTRRGMAEEIVLK
jgi:hypothetical protein